jgi:hypothetical protein
MIEDSNDAVERTATIASKKQLGNRLLSWCKIVVEASFRKCSKRFEMAVKQSDSGRFERGKPAIKLA